VSRNPAHLPLYCKITFENIWLGARISIHFILKTEEKEDVNKYACRLLSDSDPLFTIAINFRCTPARPIGSLALVHGITMLGFCPINEH